MAEIAHATYRAFYNYGGIMRAIHFKIEARREWRWVLVSRFRPTEPAIDLIRTKVLDDPGGIE